MRAGENRKLIGFLHDTGLSLREGNVATRLIADELNLNLTSLASSLLILILVVVGAAALTLDAARLVRGGIAVSYRVRFGDVGRRGLVVLVGDVAHF